MTISASFVKICTVYNCEINADFFTFKGVQFLNFDLETIGIAS